MLAAKCDRCGMFYMPKKPSDIDYIHGHTYPRVVYLNSDGNQRDYDLCPFCVQELEGFMKGGKNGTGKAV